MSTLVDAPARVDGVQLLGETVGSGYRNPPSLVRRTDGQTLQLTPLLYAVLDAVDGHRTPGEIAHEVSHALQRGVSEEIVVALMDQHLRPLGLIRLSDGSEPPLKRSNPLLGLKLKYAVTDPVRTRRITDPFRVLFRPLPMALVVLGFLAVTAWVFFWKGLGPAAYDAFQRAAPAVAGLRGDRALGWLPRVRARGGRTVQRGRSRHDGRRALPGVAGLLHRRDRQLPPRPGVAGSARTSAACTSTRSWSC